MANKPQEEVLRDMESKKNAIDLIVQKHSPLAQLPKRGTEFAAGYDLFSVAEVDIGPNESECINTGISIALPPGTYGRIAPRSGLAVRNWINVHGGVIDEDYRGILQVLLFNHGQKKYHVSIGDRIAQLIVTPVLYPKVLEQGDLEKTSRGSSGFGSTGL
jgi:dUTP pyrophosphatase